MREPRPQKGHHKNLRPLGVPPMNKLELGGILGALEFVSVLPPGESGQRWHFKDQFGIVLGKKCALPFRPYKGQLGFYQVEITREEQALLEKAGML